jgi:hypothetical protein
MRLSDSNILEYNGYTFIENAVENTNHVFPSWFQMFAFNDKTGTLVFLGIYLDGHSSEDAQEVRDYWGSFVEQYFSDGFDWSESVKKSGDGLVI